jgi:hypothetical protein
MLIHALLDILGAAGIVGIITAFENVNKGHNSPFVTISGIPTIFKRESMEKVVGWIPDNPDPSIRHKEGGIGTGMKKLSKIQIYSKSGLST